jgi:hypothetical protein
MTDKPFADKTTCTIDDYKRICLKQADTIVKLREVNTELERACRALVLGLSENPDDYPDPQYYRAIMKLSETAENIVALSQKQRIIFK